MWVRFTPKLNSFIFSSKPSEDSHTKLGSSRHKQYNTANRPPTPRTPKHRLSVDPNLQIPEVLNSASKKDLLRRVCHKCSYGASRTLFFFIGDFTMIIFQMVKKLHKTSQHRMSQKLKLHSTEPFSPVFFWAMLLNVIKF